MLIRGEGNQTIEKNTREVLSQIPRDPDSKEALMYYQRTFKYTEDLRNILKNLRQQIMYVQITAPHYKVRFCTFTAATMTQFHVL